MKVNCGICRVEKDLEQCHEIELSEEEKQGLASHGAQPQEKYHYCLACWRLMSGPHAATFMANRIEGALQKIGVPRRLARLQAEKYKTKLLEIAKNATQRQ